MKIKQTILFIILLNIQLLFAITPKELYSDSFQNCERMIFETNNQDNNERLFCYSEIINHKRYLRLIGLAFDNSITRTIQITLDVDPDSLEYIKISNRTLRFVIGGIEGYEDFLIDLKNNTYQINEIQTKKDFWKKYDKVPFYKEYSSNKNNSYVTLYPYTLKLNNISEQGFLDNKDGVYTFQTDTNKYVLCFTEIYNTMFLYLLTNTVSNQYPYSNTVEIYFKTSLNGYKTKPLLKGVDIIKVNDYIKEEDKKSGIIEYRPVKQFDTTVTPWAVKSDSNNKSIIVNINEVSNKNFPVKHLVFLNGFVNSEKSYLYKQNSRAKTIRIKTSSVP